QKSRTQGGFSRVGAKWNTDNLPQLLCSPNQSRKRCACNPWLCSHAGLRGTSQHLRHGGQVAVKLLTPLLIKGRRIKRWGRTRYARRRMGGRGYGLWFRQERVGKWMRNQRGSLWREQGKGELPV